MIPWDGSDGWGVVDGMGDGDVDGGYLCDCEKRILDCRKSNLFIVVCLIAAVIIGFEAQHRSHLQVLHLVAEVTQHGTVDGC